TESERHFSVVQADLSRLTDAHRTVEEALATRTAEAERLASSLGSRDAELAKRADEAARLESEITRLRERVSTLSSALEERAARLAHATDAAAILTAEPERPYRGRAADVGRLSEALRAAEEALATRTAEAEWLASSLGSRDAELAKRADEAARLESKITGLRTRVTALSRDLGTRAAQMAPCTGEV